MVRAVLDELPLDYETVTVPWSHQERKEVHEVSGQTYVPVVVDGDVVLSDEYEIVRYLNATYSKKTNCSES